MKKLAILVAISIAPLHLAGNDGSFQDAQITTVSYESTSFEQRIAHLEQELASLRSGNDCSEGGCNCNCCCPGWFATGDYFQWNVERNDLAFAIPDPAGLGVPSSGQPVLQLDPDQDVGFRVGVGRRTIDGLEIGVKYTHFEASGTRTYAPGAGQVLAVLSSPSTGLTNADTAVAASKLDYDVLDVELGTWFDATDYLSLLAMGGVRYSSIDHRIQAQYNGGAFVNGLVDVPTNMDGFGGRLGGAMHWALTSNLSLFGNTAVSVNSTRITASRREENAGAITINSSRTTHPLTPTAEVAFGTRYMVSGVSIAAGYEWTNWFNVVAPLEFADNFNGGTLGSSERDLGLHGWFVNSTFAY